MNRWIGDKNPRWNGGVRLTQGYRTIKQPLHPNAGKDGYVREHVYVMSQHLGRPIERHEVVHHINEDRMDNSLENLQLMTRSEHHSLHHKHVIKPNSIANLRGHTSKEMRDIWRTSESMLTRRTVLACAHCGGAFFRRRITKPHRFCSFACYNNHRAKRTRP